MGLEPVVFGSVWLKMKSPKALRAYGVTATRRGVALLGLVSIVIKPIARRWFSVPSVPWQGGIRPGKRGQAKRDELFHQASN